MRDKYIPLNSMEAKILSFLHIVLRLKDFRKYESIRLRPRVRNPLKNARWFFWGMAAVARLLYSALSPINL
jgi:hypothetical protein